MMMGIQNSCQCYVLLLDTAQDRFGLRRIHDRCAVGFLANAQIAAVVAEWRDLNKLRPVSYKDTSAVIANVVLSYRDSCMNALSHNLRQSLILRKGYFLQ